MTDNKKIEELLPKKDGNNIQSERSFDMEHS